MNHTLNTQCSILNLCANFQVPRKPEINSGHKGLFFLSAAAALGTGVLVIGKADKALAFQRGCI